MGGEIQLTDGIAALLRREKVYAYQYEGKRYDCGSKEGFLEATVELALRIPKSAPAFATTCADRLPAPQTASLGGRAPRAR